MANKDFKIKNGLDIQSPLPVSMGGTGQTTTGNTLNALLPSQAGNANKVLSSDGTSTSWVSQTTAYQRGGTESRPASPTVGDLYYNTDTSVFEQYVSTGWFIVAAAPSAPTSVTATNSGSGRAFDNGSASVAFSAGTSGGITSSFVVTPTPSTSPATFSGSSSPITVTNLASSTQYTYTVTGSSAYGTSAASSASAGVTATTVPAAPTINSVTSSGGNAAIITFTAGATGGSAITEYTITSSPSTTTQTTSSSPYTFTGLTLDTSYTFNMTATNANGTSASTTSSSVTIVDPDSGVMYPISTITVDATSVNGITFSSIPQTYTHLQLRYIARTSSTNNEAVILTFNGDSSGSYGFGNHRLEGNGSTATGANGGGSPYTAMFINTIPPTNSTANVYGGGVIDILDYTNTNKNKVARGLGGFDANGSGVLNLSSGAYFKTNAITSIAITITSGVNYLQNSQFSLYGIKGA
jgi:hypothetical protein